MESVNVEVRQPYCLPVNIRVPIWEALKERQQKAKQQERDVRDYDSQLQQLGREAPSLTVKQARARLEAKKAEAEFWRDRTQNEHDQLLQDCAFKLFRRALLTQELAELPDTDSPLTMHAFQPGQKPIRPKIEILTELSECLNWLAWFSSGDEGIAREAAEIGKRLRDAWAQV